VDTSPPSRAGCLVLAVWSSAGSRAVCRFSMTTSSSVCTSFLKSRPWTRRHTYHITHSKKLDRCGELDSAASYTRRQTTLNSCPEHHTSFVFASRARGACFFCASILLMLYLLLVLASLGIVTIASLPVARAFAGGSFRACCSIFVNVGMTM